MNSNVVGIFEMLSEKGIDFKVVDGRLICDAPKGVITKEIADVIKDNKQIIVGQILKIQKEITATIYETRDGKNEVSRTINYRERLPFQKNTKIQVRKNIQNSSVDSVASSTECYVMPCSFNQQRLWFLDQLAPGGSEYNVLAPLRIRGLLDVGALQKTLNEIVRRHEVFRTTFGEDNGVPVQVIWPELRLNFAIVDISNISESDKEQALQEAMTIEGKKPFDLKKGPLCCANLYVLGPKHYALFWNMHHIVSDGWSYTILMKEIEAIYTAFSQGLPCPLPELQIQYADYALWQREQMAGNRLNIEIEHWRKQLSGAPKSIDLPMDYQRTPVLSSKGHIQTIWLPDDLFKKLKTLCKKEKTTMFMTTLSAFFVLLWRYSYQKDIIVGTAVSNRDNIETENLIGLFVNTLPIRAIINADESFREFLGQVRSTCVEGFNHQELPFDKLVQDLSLSRDLSRHPVFQVVFLCNEAFIQPPKVFELEMSHIHIDRQGSPVDITMFLIERDDKIRCSIEYKTDLYKQSTIERMLGHFQCLLESIVTDPERRIGELAMLAESERKRLLVEWNDTAVEYPRDKCIHQLFEEQAARTPEAIAVIFEEQVFSYQELNRRANQLAHHLQKIGVGPETLVGICVERSLDMVVGILGVLKAGGAYLPLDSSYPKERLAFMISDAKLRIMLAQKRTLEIIPENNTQIILFDEISEKLSTENKENINSGVNINSLAYVIYTSGSTGKPKGTLIEHRGVPNLISYIIGLYGLGPNSRFLQFAAFGFDASVTEIFGTLLSGGTLCLAPQETIASAQKLVELIKKQEITVICLPPSLLSVLPIEDTPSLKTVISAGEKCSWGIALQWALGRRFINGYGPTEVTVAASFYLVDQDRSNESVSVPIGRPIPNSKIYILDGNLQLVPVGVAGELHVGGIGLARGYLNRPELTAIKFIPDPFSEDPNDRLYKTGDLARFLADGNIEFLGRIDHQVKVRGFRIELGEIEARLAEIDDVSDCAVVVGEYQPGDQRLVAYYVTKSGNDVPISKLRNYFLAKLPGYMVPQHFVRMNNFPLTPNGKVDRNALPMPETRSVSELEFVAPRTETESRIAEIWKEVLQVERVGVNDNFFDLGGHSLLATKIVSRINKLFTVDIPLRKFFEDNTISAIAAPIDNYLWNKLESEKINSDEEEVFEI
jgi:amino acid adenylation domain-containing protein